MAEENEQEVYRPYVAELADKRGYIHPIHAKQLAEERTVTMTGDVTGSANWDFGEPATTGQSSESMALTIGNKKVTTDKIDDKAVGSGQMADHSVGLTQIDTNAITSTATSTGADKDKLITSEGVRNAIDNAIEGRGIDYGPMTVDQINALTDIPTGSTAHIIAGGTATVITDGDLPVRVGEDVKYHISGNSHGWYSLDGEFKLKQTAKTDPTASGTTITAIDSITQNENGEITATKKTIRTGNASDTGVVKLSDSHTSDSSTNGGVAATPAAVKAAYDLAAGKKDKQTPLDTDTSSGSGKGGTTKTLTRLVQDADGAITPTFSNIADASGSSKGLMSSADYTKLAGIAAGATKTEASSTNGNIKIDGAETTVYTHPTQTAYTGKPTADEAPGFGGNFTVSQVTTNATGHVTGLTDRTITIPSATATTSSNGLMSSSDKSKLAGIAAGAEVNQNAFGNVKVGDVTVAADSKTDTLEIVGGTGIDAVGDTANDKVTLSLDSATQTSLGKADSAVQSVKINGGSELKDASGNVNIPIAVATGSTGAKAGALSADDKKKINDLGTAAFKSVPASGNASSTEVVLGSDTRLSAGASAVQDVTVDGASVVNSSTKVAAVPNASTSAKGAVQLAGSIGATVASENNKAATEKAVRDAINDLDAEVTSNDGTNVQVKVTEADGKISAVNVTTDNTENKNNKVSAWQSTPDNTHYPSEKLVKDSLDAKADADEVVAIADSTYTRENETGNGWNKLASIQNNGTWRNNIGFFDLCYANMGSDVNKASLYVNVRWDSDRTAANILDAKVVFDNYNTAFNVAVVNRASSSSVITEIWAYLPKGNYSMSLSYRSGSTKIGSAQSHSATLTNDKDNWEFFSYVATSESKPVEDLANNVKVVDAARITNQHAIASPTNNNLVAMDANGLVKDSGLAKASVESAISSAGSAIQGVKVNNTTLTPDANKVVTVPLATTSADGAMSAADKTKLDAVDDVATLNSSASCYGILLTDLTISTGYATADYVATLYIDTNIGTPSASREIIDIKFIFRSNSGGSYQVWSAVSEHRMSNSSSTIPFRIAYKTDANAVSIYLLWKDDGSTTSENYRVRLKTLSKLGCTTISYPLTRLSEQLTGFTLFTRRYMANTTESSGTAPVKVDAYGALTPVPMDSTPTASSTNLMTSGDIKTALDTWPASAVKPNSLVFAYVDLSFSGVSWSDFAGAGTNSLFAKIPWDSNTSKSALIYGRITAHPNDWTTNVGTASTTNYGLFVAYKARDAYVVEFYPNGKATSNSDGTVLMHLSSAGISRIEKRVTAIGAGAVGSTSIPTYVEADGEIKACTDDFVHDGDLEAALPTSGTPSNTYAINIVGYSASLIGSSLDNTSDLNDVKVYVSGGKSLYYWASASKPSNVPTSSNTCFMECNGGNTAGQTTQIVHPMGADNTVYYWIRAFDGSSWSAWKKCYYEATSTYSSTGTQAVNGTAVAAALATSLTEVEYVAAQSGGGGNLNKTKNGSTTSVLAFMSDAEAIDLWRTAWDEAD